MSLVFLMCFLGMLNGELQAIENGVGFFTVWALFSIADAQWVSMLFKK